MSGDLKGQARRDYWQSLGQCQRAYCRAHELYYPQFVYWRRKLRQGTTSSSARASSGFVAVSPATVAAAGSWTLVLPNGIELRGVEAANLDVVLRLLGRLS